MRRPVVLLSTCLLAGACATPPPVFRPTPETADPAQLALVAAPGEPASGLVSQTLRVVSLNIKKPQSLAELELRYDGVRHADLDERIDLWLLQEVETIDRKVNAAQWLATRFGLNYVYAPISVTGDQDTHGLAILSRYPISDFSRSWLPRYRMLFNTRDRGVLSATIEVGDRQIRVYSVHLDTKLNIDQRLTQIEPILKDAARHDRVLIAGDFNSNNFIWAGRALPVGYDDQAAAVDRLMLEHGYSAPFSQLGGTSVLGMRLDGVYARGVGVQAAQVVSRPGHSDHDALSFEVDTSPGR